MTKIIKGHMSYGEPVVRGDISDIHIGKFCSIAQNVIFDCGWHHNVDFTTTFPLNVFYKELNHITSHPKSKGDINIGNDVWIGEGSIIMGGITIHNGAVIGAGSVVTKDVEPYQVVGGCPAKHIKYRVNNYQAEMLQKIKWWDWDDKKIIKKAELIMSPDVESFIKSCLE